MEISDLATEILILEMEIVVFMAIKIILNVV